jgi:hypothetical protein
MSLAVALGVVTLIMAGLGFKMSEPATATSRAKWAYRIIFAICAVISLVLIATQSYRAEKDQERAEKDQVELKGAIEKGTNETQQLKQGISDIKQLLSSRNFEGAESLADRLLNPLHGVLIPANDPTPNNACSDWGPIPSDAALLLLGDSASYTTASAGISVKGEKLLSFSRTAAGINLNVRVYSKTSKVIAQITDNELFVNPSNIFHAKRPDWSTLIISDNNGSEVLHVYFINRNAIKVMGVLATAEGPITIDEHSIQTSSGPIQMRLSRNCYPNGILSK